MANRAIRSETWHSDDSYMETPAKATILHAHVIPSHGGATWFCDAGTGQSFSGCNSDADCFGGQT